MDLEEIKKGLKAEITKRKNEQYFTFQTNVRAMCEDCLAAIKDLESSKSEVSGMLISLNEQMTDSNLSLQKSVYRMRVRFAQDRLTLEQCIDGTKAGFWRAVAAYWLNRLWELEAAEKAELPEVMVSPIIRDPVKVNNNLDPVCELFNPDGECLGKISNETAFAFVCLQVSRLRKSGYYFMFKGKRVKIGEDGVPLDIPEGFYSNISAYAREMRAGL